MLIQTHHYLATLVYQYMEEKYDITLKHNVLHYGSIVPDLIGKYARVPHYYDLSDSFYKEELEQMLEDKKYRDNTKFSYKLGVLLHFTADFFCLAHNDKVYRESIWQHLNYEMSLHQEFLSTDKKELFKYKTESQLMSLSKRHDEYLQVEKGLATDVEYIWSASINIADFLISKIILPANEEIAAGFAA